jgi:hypothetical protein
VREVIDCFVQSCECTDIKAHCHEVMNDPKYSPYDYSYGRKRIDRYIFPCKHLMPWMRFDSEHPSSYQDQIQAAGFCENREAAQKREHLISTTQGSPPPLDSLNAPRVCLFPMP